MNKQGAPRGLVFRLLDLIPRHLDFIALSFTIRIVEALGASNSQTHEDMYLISRTKKANILTSYVKFLQDLRFLRLQSFVV